LPFSGLTKLQIKFNDDIIPEHMCYQEYPQSESYSYTHGITADFGYFPNIY